MEIIAEIIIQIVVWIAQVFCEFLIQIFGELIAEFIGHCLKEPFKRPKPIHPWLAATGYGIFGALVGAISLWMLPSLFISAGWLRIASLIATPLLAGLMMERLGAWREMKGQATIRLDAFSYGFVFALSMAIVRFTWGH